MMNFRRQLLKLFKRSTHPAEEKKIPITRESPVGRLAKLNLPASWDFPDLREKVVKIISIDKKGFCEIESEGKIYPCKLGLRGELILID